MPITRAALQDLVNTYGGGSYDNIDFIMTTNSDVIRMDWYRVEGRGVQWVDKELPDGSYRTGVELYGNIAPSSEKGMYENAAKVVKFIDVEMIDIIAFKAPTPPPWAWKELSHDAFLSSITINGNPLVGFNKNKFDYDVILPRGTTNVPVVGAIASDQKSTIDITQAQSPNGQSTIKVTAEDETTVKTYTIKFSVALNNNADLSSITINNKPLQSFDKNQTWYTVTLNPGDIIPAVVAATTEDQNATLTINQPFTSDGTATIKVIAENGTTTKIYTIKFEVA